MKNENRSHTVFGKYATFAIVMVFVLVAILATPVFAKYITSADYKKNEAPAKEFYFGSDYLSDAAEIPEIHIGAAVSSVTINLYNYADDLRYANLDIDYTVTVTNGATVENGSGRLTGNGKHSADVTISDLASGQTYTITATGSNGFVKTLRAKIVVDAVEDAVYKHVDNTGGEYVILTVWTTGSVKGSARITYPAGLIPDNTDSAMRNWHLGQSTETDGSSFANMYSSHKYRFFCHENVAADQFSVTVNGVAATTVDVNG